MNRAAIHLWKHQALNHLAGVDRADLQAKGADWRNYNRSSCSRQLRTLMKDARGEGHSMHRKHILGEIDSNVDHGHGLPFQIS